MKLTIILLSIILTFFTVFLVIALPERGALKKTLPMISTTPSPAIQNLSVIKIGDKASEIELTDFDGNKTNLSQFIGKPIFIDFWASSCPFCQVEMPAIEILFQEYRDQVIFIGINRLKFAGETKAKAIQYAKTEVRVSYLLYVDEDDNLYQAFGENLNSMPLAVWIDKEGKVTDKKFGPKTSTEIRLVLQKLLQ